jgi:hypothetical protein
MNKVIDRLCNIAGSDAKPSFTAAIYHPSDRNLRAINIFGKWQLQRNSGEPSTREHDPWNNTGHRSDDPPQWKELTAELREANVRRRSAAP